MMSVAAVLNRRSLIAFDLWGHHQREAQSKGYFFVRVIQPAGLQFPAWFHPLMHRSHSLIVYFDWRLQKLRFTELSS
jgi:hypothetical protein